MSDFKFIKYQPTPDDQFMLGIASVLLYGKIIVRYKLVQSKDQKGNFFCVANYTLTEHGEKKYIPCVMMDSNSDKEMLEDFIRDHVNAAIHGKSANPQSIQNLNMQSNPYTLQQGQAHLPNSAREVANEQPLPF